MARAAGFKRAEVGSLDSLGHDFDDEPALHRLDHGQAGAADTDAVRYGEAGKYIGCFDIEARAIESGDFTQFFNDSAEH